jgi:hypothetical protein
MNGIHDCGGMHGLGPIDIDPDQPVFRHDWERRMFGMFILAFAGGHYNIDQFRAAIEEMGPAEYIQSTYYEHWLHSLEKWCKLNGSLSEDEIVQRMDALRQEAH